MSAYREPAEIAADMPKTREEIDWAKVRVYVALAIVILAAEGVVGGIGAAAASATLHRWWIGALWANAVVFGLAAVVWAGVTLDRDW